MTTPLKADIMQLPPGQTPSNAWNGVQGSTDTVLFANNDLNNTWTLGFKNNITVGGPNTIPVPPSGTVTLAANRTIYAIAPSGTTPLIIIPGGGAYFQGLTQGQGQLVLPSVRSPNFNAGVSGWIIRKDGSAEFNNLVIRGTFFGINFELDSNGLRFYSSTPALGNLILSVGGTTGYTDPHGNHVNAGLNVQENTFGTNAQLLSNILKLNAGVNTIAALSYLGLFLYNQTTPTQLLASLASATGTDAQSGSQYNQGLQAAALTLVPQGVAPTPPAFAPVFYADSLGIANVANALGDTNTYKVGHLVNTFSGIIVNGLTTITTVPLAAGRKYRVKLLIDYSGAATGAPTFTITDNTGGAGIANLVGTGNFQQNGTGTVANHHAAAGGAASFTGPTFTSTAITYDFIGEFFLNVGGFGTVTLTIQGNNSGGTYNINGWIEIQPI